MRTLRKPGDIHVGSPFMVTDSRLTDEHYAIDGDLVSQRFGLRLYYR